MSELITLITPPAFSWRWIPLWADAWDLWSLYTRYHPIGYEEMDEILQKEAAQPRTEETQTRGPAATHTLIDQRALMAISKEYQISIPALLRHLSTRPSLNSSVFMQLLVHTRLAQRPEATFTDVAQYDQRYKYIQIREGHRVASMASSYYEGLTGVKPARISPSDFKAVRKQLAAEFGGLTRLNSLLGFQHEVPEEDWAESTRLVKALSE